MVDVVVWWPLGFGLAGKGFEYVILFRKAIFRQRLDTPQENTKKILCHGTFMLGKSTATNIIRQNCPIVGRSFREPVIIMTVFVISPRQDALSLGIYRIRHSIRKIFLGLASPLASLLHA